MSNTFSEAKFDQFVEENHYREQFNFLNAPDCSVEDPNEPNDEIVVREIQTYNAGMYWWEAELKQQSEDVADMLAHCEFHKPITRGNRRYHTQKIKRRMKHILNSHGLNITNKAIGKLAAVHGVACSCAMCGNPRKTFKGRLSAQLTHKEQQAIKEVQDSKM